MNDIINITAINKYKLFKDLETIYFKFVAKCKERLDSIMSFAVLHGG